MRINRGRTPQRPQIKTWLTQDVKIEEPAPWVRINLTKNPFRPPTLFNYDNPEEHEDFDKETAEIKKAYEREVSLSKKRKAARRKEFWEIVNRIEDADPILEANETSPRDEEEEETTPEDLRSRYKRNARESILAFDPEVLEKLPEHIYEAINERLDEILSLPTYQEQVYLVLDLANNEAIPTIAQLFGVTRQTMWSHAHRRGLTKQNVGRPSLLSGTEMVILKNHIVELYHSKRVPNIPTLLQFIADSFKKDLSSDTLLHILERKELGKTCQGHPVEQTRCDADLDAIIEFYDELSAFFEENLVPDAFCFNVDESGFQPWADKTTELVVIPTDADDTKVVFPVDRTRKRSSLVATIAADGTYLAPLIIIPRKTIEKEMLSCGYRPENNHYIVSQECGFITSLIWDFWVETIFIPEVQRRRTLHNYSGEVVLLLDGCSAHSTDFFLDECVYNGIRIFELPPNASDQIQVLDLGVFGIQKRATKKIRPAERFSQQTKELIKICSSWQSVATPPNITAAFAEAGLTKKQIENDNTFYMQADIKHAQQVRGIEHEAFDDIDSKKQIKVQAF